MSVTYDKLLDPRHVEPVLREKWEHETVCWYCEPPEKDKTAILTTATSFRRKAGHRPVLKIYRWVYEVDTHWNYSAWGDPLDNSIYISPRFDGYPKLKR